MLNKKNESKTEYAIKTQKFNLIFYLLLFFLGLGCFILGPLEIGIYNNSDIGDLHDLYIGKIGFWLFPVGIWFFSNLCIRIAYNSLINEAYKLEKKHADLSPKGQKDFNYAIKSCLRIKRIGFLFFFFPNRFDPYNKEIDQYSHLLQAKQPWKKLVVLTLFFLMLVYVALGIFSWTQLISDWNYQTSYPVVTSTVLKTYENGVKQNLKNHSLIQKRISKSKLSDEFWFLKDGQQNKPESLNSLRWLILPSTKTEGLIDRSDLHSSLFLPYEKDLWAKGINFYIDFYVTHLSKTKGELWFYIEAMLVDRKKLNNGSLRDLKEGDPAILYKQKSKPILFSGFMISNSTNV